MLIEEPMRFGVLTRSLPGVTQHLLTEQLKELASNGIVVRRAYAEFPRESNMNSPKQGST